MTDKTTTSFPTMGTSAAQATNVSGAPSTKTMLVPRGNTQAGYDSPTAAHRAVAYERNGFKGAPQVNHVYPNAPEAANTFRNVRLVPSAIGNRDFYLRRQYGQGI